MTGYDLLLSLGFTLAKQLVGVFTKAKAPQEVVDAIQAAIDAIDQHARDTMTKEQWEALRD